MGRREDAENNGPSSPAHYERRGILLSTTFVNKGKKKSQGWANVPARVMRLEPACDMGVVKGRFLVLQRDAMALDRMAR